MSVPHVPDDRIRSEKKFVHWAADLLDSEAKEVFKVVAASQSKYATMPATVENLNAMRDEILTRLSEINVLAEIDITPFYSGEPPTVEIIGKVSGDSFHQYGFDHEHKEFEVKRAVKRGEEYLGQKEPINEGPARKRSKNEGVQQVQKRETKD